MEMKAILLSLALAMSSVEVWADDLRGAPNSPAVLVKHDRLGYHYRLVDGSLWITPIKFDVPEEPKIGWKAKVKSGARKLKTVQPYADFLSTVLQGAAAMKVLISKL